MNPAERAQTVRALREAASLLMGGQLPETAPETMGEARSYMDDLSNDEKTILNHLAGPEAPAVFGRRDGDYLALIKTEPERTSEKTDLGRVARNLEKDGWLRFEEEDEGDGGYYWFTDAALSILKSLGAEIEAASKTMYFNIRNVQTSNDRNHVREILEMNTPAELDVEVVDIKPSRSTGRVDRWGMSFVEVRTSNPRKLEEFLKRKYADFYARTDLG